MKTRHEDQRQAMEEARLMILKGRTADALETLSAALEAPTVSERDAVLEEAAQTASDTQPDGAFSKSGRDRVVFRAGARTGAQRIRALQSAPAQVVRVAKVREVVLAVAAEGSGAGPSPLLQSMAHEVLRRLGVDLDAAPAKDEACPQCHCPRHAGPCRSTSPRTGRSCACSARHSALEPEASR